MRIVFYISGHGFGHAARSLEVVNALARLHPSAAITLRTAVPRWFLDASLTCRVDVLPGHTDPGIVQPDSLSIDEEATARQAASFYREFEAHVAAERELLARLGATLVVGDIPPLACAAAAAAGLPGIACGNFTWDWIYAGLGDFETRAPGVAGRVREAYGTATMGLRLPFAGGFEGVSRVEDVPLVARRATIGREEARRRLGLPGGRPIVLATFGGHGGGLPLDRAAETDAFLLVATEYEAGAEAVSGRHLRVVTNGEQRAQGLGHTDLLAACDAVATKLGYGIVSDCIANDVPMLYTLRGTFPEQDVFARELPQVLRCRSVARDTLRSGRWDDAIAGLLAQPAPPRRLPSDGAPVVAARILAAATA